MEDQAERLRERIKYHQSHKQTKTLAVVSGKGGVGKSNFALNFAISLKKRGHSVLLFDMDMGMGNIDVLMGISSSHSIVEFFSESTTLKELICKIPESINYISGGSGLAQLTKITETQLQSFFDQFSNVLHDYDYVILDMGAGMDEESLSFILSVDEVIVITTPEPTSIMDAYAAMKYITIRNHQIPFHLLVNRATSMKEGEACYKRISTVLEQFLDRSARLLGVIPEDPAIPKAVKRQIPFFELNKRAPASKALCKITEKYCHQVDHHSSRTKINFITKLKRFLNER